MENRAEIVKEIQDNLDRLLGLIHQGLFGFYELKSENGLKEFESITIKNDHDTIANMLYRMGDDDPQFRLALFKVVEKLQEKYRPLNLSKN